MITPAAVVRWAVPSPPTDPVQISQDSQGRKPLVNDGVFFGAGDDKHPVIGSNGNAGNFTVPRKPVRRRIQGIPNFVVTRGGEYCFMPGLRALRWLADLQ